MILNPFQSFNLRGFEHAVPHAAAQMKNHVTRSHASFSVFAFSQVLLQLLDIGLGGTTLSTDHSD
jgi:hypothetical protein